MINPPSGPAEPFPFRQVTVFAPAKINLILRVLDRRADGYHNLWSIMHTVGLEDEIQIQPRHGDGEIHLNCDSADLADEHSNLVYRAAQAVLEQSSVRIGLDISLRKKIPMGAGLGGGSSDAAATIVGLNRLLHLGWSSRRMAEVGQRLGSDVPFFLFAPAAVVSGRGEAVHPIGMDGTQWAALVNPGFGVETSWAYRELATTRASVRPLTAAQSALPGRPRVAWQEVVSAAENDFEPPVFAKHPILQAIKRTLTEAGAQVALLSGSGATVFGLFSSENQAREAAAQFSGEKCFKTFVVSTCSAPLALQLSATGASPLG
ncbi:MAG TPA: 4-(cytidine 5'-diphospho)-2-C-methyl-D-erythritol kinase [Nitrospira sp.]|nr:4-(cytidine 5'-diphospho)-2-C-methyl-D-erythritol kinase [Nitrospira sp.]